MLSLVKPYLAPRDEVLPAIEAVLYSGYIAAGLVTDKFETDIEQFLNKPNVVCVNSGSAALHIALELANVQPDDEVISTAMTAEPTNTVIAQTGATIVWADVNPLNGLIDPASIKDKITSRTKAIVTVDYAGMVCDYLSISKIASDYGIAIIEDAAHALGAKYDGESLGKYADFVCYSFQAIKHMTTVDGGALVIKDESLVPEARKLRWFGLDKSVSRLENDIKKIGYKYAMNNVTAALGRTQIKHAEEIINKHIENGRYYDQKLAQVKGVSLVPYYSGTEPSYWLYTLRVERREDFIAMLKSKEIEASPLHHRSDSHSVFASSKCPLPNLDEWCSSYVHIPCGWWVSEMDSERVVEAIKTGW